MLGILPEWEKALEAEDGRMGWDGEGAGAESQEPRGRPGVDDGHSPMGVIAHSRQLRCHFSFPLFFT
jgi:hypothetical protein